VRRPLTSVLVALALLVSAPAAFAGSTTTSSTTTGTSTQTLSLPGSNPLSPGIPDTGGQTPTTSVVTTTTTTGGGGLGQAGTILLIVFGGLILLGIPFYIWFDARRKAAKIHHGLGPSSSGTGPVRKGSQAPPKSRKLSAAERKRRKRGKAR
jgi:hypothetical protein